MRPLMAFAARRAATLVAGVILAPSVTYLFSAVTRDGKSMVEALEGLVDYWDATFVRFDRRGVRRDLRRGRSAAVRSAPRLPAGSCPQLQLGAGAERARVSDRVHGPLLVRADPGQSPPAVRRRHGRLLAAV